MEPFVVFFVHLILRSACKEPLKRITHTHTWTKITNENERKRRKGRKSEYIQLLLMHIH